jgi:hypothetical protein
VCGNGLGQFDRFAKFERSVERSEKTVDAMRKVLHNLASLLLTQQRKTGGTEGEVS